MTSAIWAVAYDIANNDRDRYLDWFHCDHIAEKLAREGYRWAAHYEGPTHGQTDDATGFVALFGGDTTGVFLNPSPAQLKTMQADTTRQMIGLRRPARMVILAHEWTLPHDAASFDGLESITLLALEAVEADEAIGAWAVQIFAPALTEGSAAGTLTKLISVTGAPHHYMIISGDPEMAKSPTDDAVTLLKSGTSDLEITTHWRGQRIWPD